MNNSNNKKQQAYAESQGTQHVSTFVLVSSLQHCVWNEILKVVLDTEGFSAKCWQSMLAYTCGFGKEYAQDS
jgi:hypothetical protein